MDSLLNGLRFKLISFGAIKVIINLTLDACRARTDVRCVQMFFHTKDILISLKNVGHAEGDFLVSRRKKIFTIMKRKSTFEFISFFVIRNIISVEAKQPFKLKTPASNDL